MAHDPDENLPLDPDVEIGQRRSATGRLEPSLAAVLPLIAAGGVIGALARYQAGLFWPTPATAFPATTFAVNVVGSALLGLLVALVTERGRGHPLLRPFLGTGVLGGFTTFSTFSVDVHRLIGSRPGVAVGYVAATAMAAVLAAWAGLALGRQVAHRHR